MIRYAILIDVQALGDVPFCAPALLTVDRANFRNQRLGFTFVGRAIVDNDNLDRPVSLGEHTRKCLAQQQRAGCGRE
jgi:hypothetical protein